MPMRVTMNTMLERALSNARRQTDRLAALSVQAQTGNRIQQPSDDPAAAVALLSNRAHDERLTTYLTNVSAARNRLDMSVTSLQQVGDVLTQARSLAIEGSNSGYNPGAFRALATEVDSLLTRLQDLANTQFEGRYLYAGTASDTRPFVADPVTGSVRYQGADDRGAVPINTNQSVDVFYAGREIFQARDRQATVFRGTTGAAAGLGTDSAVGQGTLQVRHTATSYAAGSGVQPGTGSAASDTVLGPPGAHQLTVIDTTGTGAGGTVSLNGGPPVAFTSTDMNLPVTDNDGRTVFVNTTAITPGFNGSVALTAAGTLSTDGGATTVPIDFTADQVVTDAATGAVTHVDTTGVRGAGDEHLERPGTYDAFQILAALRDDLNNKRGLSAAEHVEAIAGRLGELERIHDHVLGIIGEQSANLQNLEGLQAQLGDIQLQGKKQAAELNGADFAALVLNLQSQQSLFQATLAVTARLFDQSLLDFIR